MAAAHAPTLSATAPSAAPAPIGTNGLGRPSYGEPAPARPRSTPHAPSVALPSLSVVIVNFCQWLNTARLTRQLRRSHLARAGEAEIVIVDNHSPPHRLLGRLRRTAGVKLRRFRRNRGFARAVNAGYRLSQGEWLLLLNPDVSVPTGFLDDVDVFMHGLQDDPRIGIVGLGVRNADGSPQPSCGPLPTFRRTLTGLFAPRSRRKCRLIRTEEQTEVPWATGCALLIRRECFEEIAGFDEDFFLYYEDVDLCRRASERNWKVHFQPKLQVKHHTPLHSRKAPATLQLLTRHALLTYGLKHWPRWQTCVLGGIITAESLVRQAVAWWSGRSEEAYYHGQSRKLVRELLTGRSELARSRLYRAADQLDSVASAQDGRT